MNRQTDILLVAINAGYAHTSMSLRCLLANLGELKSRTRILEVDAQLSARQISERILETCPVIIAFSAYIWNVTMLVDVLRFLKTLRPDIHCVVGGPQVVPGDDPSGLLPLADVAVCGEAESVVASIFKRLLDGEQVESLIIAELPDLSTVALPYAFYTDEDLAHRMVYAETSRGCPFRCAYCTSAGSRMRYFPLQDLLDAFSTLLDRGVSQFKFLDRSFNHGGEQSLAVLDFFLERQVPGLRLHFEFTPATLTEAWRNRLCRFEPGMLHIEMGVQTWDIAVAHSIFRPMEPIAVEQALRFMIDEARADVHADLIAGLPGESPASFAAGFDRLVALGPAEIQVGILKRLPGTAISEHDAKWKVKWSPLPPYEIIENTLFSFEELSRMERFSRCWDLLYNRGRFKGSVQLLWRDGASPFSRIENVSDEVYERCGRMYGIGPKRLAEALLEVLVRDAGVSVSEAKASLERDARESAWDKS